jgi:hypothetical protein
MDRISSVNFQTIGGRRTWLDKNPGVGVPFGTTWSAIWAAGVQESIVETIEAAGLTPVDSALGATDTQLRDAIKILAARAVLPTGRCRLSVASSSSLLLSPFDGNLLWVNGAPVAIPSAGVSIANTGLTAATLYYVYAWVNAGALALELSTTGHATSTADGTQIKTGDATRAFVGMVYMDAGTPGIFADSPTKRFVANWFNRRGRDVGGNTTAGATTGSSTAVELSTAARIQFLAWADELPSLFCAGNATNTNTGYSTSVQIGIDGTVSSMNASFFPSTAGLFGGLTAFSFGSVAEGLHTASPFGLVQPTSTGTFFVNLAGSVRI